MEHSQALFLLLVTVVCLAVIIYASYRIGVCSAAEYQAVAENERENARRLREQLGNARNECDALRAELAALRDDTPARGAKGRFTKRGA